MAILDSDILLLESERMDDIPDGGGRMASIEVEDNVPGNIFPKISRIDGTYGRVNMRKIYLSVKTAGLDVYAGAHMILSEPPENERVHCLIFSTGSHFDERDAARNRIESFVVAGPLSRFRLYGDQLLGQRTVRVYALLETPLPEVGEVLVLSLEPGSTQQFVRITDVEHAEQTFIDTTGAFVRRVMTLSISDSLRQDFDGAEPIRYTYDPAPTKIRQTDVADASSYFGVHSLEQDAAAGDLSLKLDDIYTPIVPTTQAESAISLASVPGASFLFHSGTFKFGWYAYEPDDIYVTKNGSTFFNMFKIFDLTEDGTYDNFEDRYRYGADTVLGIPFMPSGSRMTNISGTGGWWSSDQDGKFYLADNTYMGYFSDDDEFIPVGITQSYWLAWGGGHQHEFKVGTWVGQPSHTHEVVITLGTRRTIYSVVLSPIPRPGVLVVSYRSLGTWYELRDNGEGELRGDDPDYGVGTIDYTTGGNVVTLGALPDVGSSILFSWSTHIHFQKSTTATVSNAFVNNTLGEAAAPGTCSFTWLENGVEQTATAAVDGQITGDADGALIHATGEYYLEFPRIYDQNTQLRVDYEVDPTATQVLTGISESGGNVSFNLGIAIKPGSLNCQWEVRAKYARSKTKPRYVRAVVYRDPVHNIPHYGMKYAGASTDETLKLQDYSISATDDGQGKINEGYSGLGTVVYATGEVLLPVLQKWPYRQFDYVGMQWETFSEQHSTSDWSFEGGQIVVSYIEASAVPVTKQVFHDLPSPRVRLGDDLIEDTVIPGSVLFAWNGAYYMDRNGSIYKDADPSNGSGILAGSIDYDSREVVFDVYNPHRSGGGIVVYSLLTEYGTWTTTEMQFRTAGSPVSPASFYVQAVTHDGNQITATSDQNGNISGGEITGLISQDVGVASVRFGKYVLDSSLTADEKGEPWYDPADVLGDGTIWRPTPVLPATVKYSATIQTNLPLDADQLGLDPVRLPSDGRVPSVRPGDVVVIHDTGDTELPNPVVASATYSAGRADLEGAWLQDDTGTRVASDQSTVNLIAGSITMAAVLDLGAYIQPLHLMHRVEDIALSTDAQIDGTVSLSAPLLHDYSAGTKISSALLLGDMSARVTNLFDQNTWTGVWSDSLIGSQANAEYDDLHHPIEVVNENSVKERWRFNFTSTTVFQCYGENVGLVGTGNTSNDFSVMNPATGQPYFVIRAAGWGGGWAAGNQLRMNTEAASAPIWVTRTILTGAARTADACRLERRGDVD